MAIIGLGSGDTLFGAAGRDKVKSIDCIEIISSELDSLKDLRKRDVCKQLDSILNTAVFTIILRMVVVFVSDKSRKYDVIEADACVQEALMPTIFIRLKHLFLLRIT